jgi:DNA replication protein DnaC
MAYAGRAWVGSTPRSSRTFDDLTRDRENAIAFNTLRRAATVLKPALIYGPVGTGKTTLMAAVYAVVSAAVKTRWTTAEDLVADERAGWAMAKHYTDFEQRNNAREAAVDVPVLFLDDVGWEHARSTTVADVIAARYDRNRPTYLTTNLDPDGVAERYGERIHSRLCETNVFIPVLGHDRRRTLVA